MGNILALPMDSHHGDLDDEATLVGAARLDPRAFGGLHARYSDRVYRYVRARTGTDEDAADLTQQVFLQALDALPRYRDRGAPFAAWLFRIARNVVTDAHRRRRSHVSLDTVPDSLHPASEGEDLEDAVVRREALTRLSALLAGLDDDGRELIRLRFMAGLTVREMASVLGKSESTVKRGLAATLQTLKEQYDAE